MIFAIGRRVKDIRTVQFFILILLPMRVDCVVPCKMLGHKLTTSALSITLDTSYGPI